MFCDYFYSFEEEENEDEVKKIKKMIKKIQIRRNLRLLVLLSTAFKGNVKKKPSILRDFP